jgi:hypothetical protein
VGNQPIEAPQAPLGLTSAYRPRSSYGSLVITADARMPVGFRTRLFRARQAVVAIWVSVSLRAFQQSLESLRRFVEDELPWDVS